MLENLLIGQLISYPSLITNAIEIIDDKNDFFIEKENKLIYDCIKNIYYAGTQITIQSIALYLTAHNDDINHKTATTLLINKMGLDIGLPSDFTAIALQCLEAYMERKIIDIIKQSYNEIKNKVHPIVVLEGLEKKTAELNKSTTFTSSPKINKIIADSISDIIKNWESQNPVGISTGFSNINNMHGRFMPGTLIVIAARPAMGKTAFALTLALNAAKMNHSILFFSIEMSALELSARMLSAEAMVQNSTILRNAQRLTMEEINKIAITGDIIKSYKMTIIDDGYITISKVKANVKKYNPQLIIVDYLQIMSSTDRAQNNDANKMFEDITRDLKIVAKENNACVILLSQLNRGVEGRTDKRPLLADLRSSGGIEQNADSVMFIHRPHYYDKESEIDLAEIIIAKNRNGMTGKCDVRFMDVFTKFAENKSTYIPKINTPYKDEDNPF